MTEKKEFRLGVDIGGTKCSVVAGDNEFNILKKIVFPTESSRPWKEVIEEFYKNIDLIISELKEYNLKSIGISCGGPLDSVKGMIYSPPNLPGWDNVPVTSLFASRYKVAANLQNDANACALAEWLMGAGKGATNLIFLTFGTGMGGGLILDGKLYSGTNDLGGEVGHIRLADDGPVGYGKAGSFEGFCSGGGIARLARTIITEKLSRGIKVDFCADQSLIETIDTKAVAEAVIGGDQTATEILDIAARRLGQGLALLIDILNPECIVIGSIYARNEDFFRPRVLEVLEKEALAPALNVCRIVPAGLGESIGDYAALCVAAYNDKF